MGDLATATILAALVVIASVVSVESGVSVAIIEITLGVIAANVLGVHSTPWIDFLGSFAGIVLTFLAGAEVDPALLRREWKPAVIVGGLSFLLPFVGVGLFARYVAGWSVPQAEIAGIALSTTSLAVVYAVLVETGLTTSELGKILMAATFVTDLGTALALSVLFIQPTRYLALFIIVSVLVVAIMAGFQRPFFARYGGRVIEPEIKGAFLALFVLMWTADLARSQRMNDRQLEVLLEWVKVSIPMKQRVLLTQAECRNEAVDGLPHRVTAAPKRPIVSRRLACQRHAPCLEHLQLHELPFNLLRHHVVADALQHFAEDDVRQPEALAIEFGVQPVRLRILRALEVIDPDRGVYDHHAAYFATRSRRDELRSPSQPTWPRKRRMPLWPLVWINRRSASSTTARFVRRPLLRMACRIRRSSISMFVRMAYPYV